jgi:beta-lactamase class A
MTMAHSTRDFLARRDFLAGAAAAALGATTLARPARATTWGPVPSPSSADYSPLARKIVALFDPLPGQKAIKIWAPGTNHAPEFLAVLNPATRLFCGSSFKAFVLCEALRQIDSPGVAAKLAGTQLQLDKSVWSPSSSVFNPPHLAGAVSERTTLEAMISHSDNTATDMILKHVGAGNVREFLSQIGLKNSAIPNSTREFFGYIFGKANWKTITWDEMDTMLAGRGGLAHPVINTTQTMASTPDDFVSFYSRALQGDFFKHPETLAQFRAILRIADAIPQAVPLGVSAFMKGGSIDANPSHALCLAGGMFFAGRWAYVATMINWEKSADADPETVAAFIATVKTAYELLVEGVSAWNSGTSGP